MSRVRNLLEFILRCIRTGGVAPPRHSHRYASSTRLTGAAQRSPQFFNGLLTRDTWLTRLLEMLSASGRSSARLLVVSGGIAALVVGILLFVAPPAARSQQPTTITELNQRIAQLEMEIEAAGARAEQLSKDESQQSAYLMELGTQIANTEQLINAYMRDIRRLSAEAGELRAEIAALNEEMERMGGAVSAYVVGLYKRGRSGELEIILSSETFADAVRRFKGVIVVAARQRQDVDRLAEARDQSMVKRTEITRTLDSLEQSRQAQRRARQNLDQKQAETEELLDRIAQDQQQVTQYIQEAEAQLAELIREKQRIAQRLREAGRGIDIELGGFAGMRGRLPWPLNSPWGPGEVVRAFGSLRGRDNTTTSSPGIDIMAPGPNTDIVAVHNAVVLHIGWYAYMGTVIVLDHGDAYATVYTNAVDLQVQVGEAVEEGWAMAEVGLALRPVGDEPDGYLLRFSIYEDGTAQDPLPWLASDRQRLFSDISASACRVACAAYPMYASARSVGFLDLSENVSLPIQKRAQAQPNSSVGRWLGGRR